MADPWTLIGWVVLAGMIASPVVAWLSWRSHARFRQRFLDEFEERNDGRRGRIQAPPPSRDGSKPPRPTR